jgi:hypothetical protein
MATNTVLYGAGLFNGQPGNVSYDQQLSEAQSFDSVILWTLHVHPNGDLYYNDTAIVVGGVFSDPNPTFAAYVSKLKASVQNVIWGLSSGGVTDFANIKALLATQQGTQTLKNNFSVLLKNVPAAGFDFDLEEFPLDDYTDTVITLAIMLSELGTYITFCPYYDDSFWVSCLSGIYKQNNNKQVVAWMNLQCYDGGTGNDPAQWAQAIKNSSDPTGVTDPVAFVIPGFWCYNTTEKSYMGQCPDQIETTFKNLAASDPGISGGFIWNSSDIFTNQASKACNGGAMDCNAYAQAIISGFNSPVTAKQPAAEAAV